MVSYSESPSVLLCAGDEDRTTQGIRRRAITRALRAQTDLTVDLSGLGYADVTLMIDLALLAPRLRARGRAMLLRGAQPQVRTLIEVLGIHRLPGVVLDSAASAAV